MSRSFITFGALTLLLACSIGCGNSAAARLAGKWELDTDKLVEDSQPVQIKIGDQDMGGLMKQLAKTLKVEIEFKSDGTFTTSAAGLMGAAQVKGGKWKVVKSKGNEVTISRQVDGESSAQEMPLKFLDNDTIQAQWPGPTGQPSAATFRRVKS